MLDIKWIRDNPEALKHALMRRGQSADFAEATVSEAVRLDDARRANIKSLQEAQERSLAVCLELPPGQALTRMALARGVREARSIADFRTIEGAARWLERAA